MFSYSSLVLIFTLVYLLLSIIAYFKWNFNYWSRRKVCGPKPKLFCGTFPKTSAGTCNLMEELHDIYLQYKSTHKYVGIFTAHSPKLFILDPMLAKQILTQHFKSFRNNESSQWTSPKEEQLRPCSPFVSTNEVWKERRSELTPALSPSRIRAFDSAMRDSAAKMTKYIEVNFKEPLNVKELANRFTAEFMANFIWGIEADAFASETHSTIHQMANSMISQSMKCVRYFGRTAAWPWLRKLKPVRFFPATSDQFFQQLAAQTFETRLNCKNAANRYDVINHLLQLKDKKLLSDVQIAGHTTTVLIDGFETVAIVIAHCLLLLARNPRVQQKLRHELLQPGVDVTYEVLNKLEYLDQCLQESLRIFPPLPTLFKLCTENINLQNCDNSELNLKPNDVVYISSYSFHRDADYYENPDDFWPERFDEQLGGVRAFSEQGVFLPFGDGPRICPGSKLAMAEAKMAIAEIVRVFKFKCTPETRVDNKIATDSFLLILDGTLDIVFEKI